MRFARAAIALALVSACTKSESRAKGATDEATIRALPPGPASRRADDSKGAPVQDAISGTIELAPGLAEIPGAQLFITLYESKDGGIGELGAAQRHTSFHFPFDFELTDGDSFEGGGLAGKRWILEVRVDRDGDPATRDPADLVGRAKREVTRGQIFVPVVLAKP